MAISNPNTTPSRLLKALDFFVPVLNKREGFIRRLLTRSCLGVAFSLCSIQVVNENEVEALENYADNIESVATYSPNYACSVPSDFSKAFLYTTNYSGNSIADLIVDHPDSPDFNKLHFYHFKKQDRDVDGYDLPDLQVIGACFFEKEGRFYWADAYNEAAAGTREQLSPLNYVPVITSDGLRIQ